MKTNCFFSNILIHIFFIAGCLACLIPFLLVISISISNEATVLKEGYKIIPSMLDFTAYSYIFNQPDQLIKSYGVTTFVTFIGTFISVIIMAMVGYSISRRSNKWRRGITFYVFFTMLFSGGLVPSYILITRYFNMQDTIWVLIIPGLLNAWHIILFSAFFKAIPDGLVESAKIDGANEFLILYRIVLPLSKPAIATIALFGVLTRWNDWYTCLLFIRNENLLTLQYLLQRIMLDAEFMQKNAAVSQISNMKLPAETSKMAMVILTTGPMLIIFPFFQKYFVKGLTVGSIKG